MKLSVFFGTLAFIMSFGSQPVWAQGGAGAGNGGLGLQCAGSRTKLIERVMIERKRDTAHSIRTTFLEFHRELASRLKAFDESLAFEYVKRLSMVGPVASWKTAYASRGGKRVVTFDAYLDFAIENSCELRQIAVIEKGDHLPMLTSRSWVEGREALSDLDLRLLEAHEVLYRLSVEMNVSDDPVLARNLIVDLVRDRASVRDLRLWVQLFRQGWREGIDSKRQEVPFGVFVPLARRDENQSQPWQCRSYVVADPTADGVQFAFIGKSVPKGFVGRSARMRTVETLGLISFGRNWEPSHDQGIFPGFLYFKQQIITDQCKYVRNELLSRKWQMREQFSNSIAN